MPGKRPYRRKTVFIKKRFQADFSIKFLAIIVIESVLAAGLFYYLSRGTLTAGYSGAVLTIARTRDFFLPTLLLSDLVILAVTALGGMALLVFVSHRLAGPLYRFEKSLGEIAGGDLTHRFSLRENDEMKEMGERLNDFSSKMDDAVFAVQDAVAGLEKDADRLSTLLSAGHSDRHALAEAVGDISAKVERLKASSGRFKTTRGSGI